MEIPYRYLSQDSGPDPILPNSDKSTEQSLTLEARVAIVSQRIDKLSFLQKEQLFGHDAWGEVVTEAVVSANHLKLLSGNVSESFSIRGDPVSKAKKTLEALTYLQQNDEELQKFLPDDADDIRKKRDITRMIASSTLFLADRTVENFKALQDLRVSARSIGEITGCDTSSLPEDIALDGVRGIQLYNLGNNAMIHGNKDAKLAIDGDQVVILNTSKTPLPSDWGLPGVRGPESKSTGMGGFIVSQYEYLLGNEMHVSDNQTHDAEHNQYIIHFSLPHL